MVNQGVVNDRDVIIAVLGASGAATGFVLVFFGFLVSTSALVYRAHELGYIDDRRYRALQIQMSKWHKNGPGTFAPVHGELVGRLIDVNGGTEGVSGKLGVNARHLAEPTNWSHLRVA